jgi:hypothetical protein
MKPEIAPHWRDRVRQHLLETRGEDRVHLLADDFRLGQSVRAVFPDGSEVLFRYAFYLLDPALREVAVFTKHCGYHYFPLADLQIEHLAETRVAAEEEELAGSAFALLADVTDRDTFLRFVRALAASHQRGDADVSWASERAGDYLEAAAAWADAAHVSDNGLPAQPSWRAMAEFLYAGAIYE